MPFAGRSPNRSCISRVRAEGCTAPVGPAAGSRGPSAWWKLCFQQHILPVSMGLPTTVWSYGSVNHAGSFNYPAFTIEAKWRQPVRVMWINDLKDPLTGAYLEVKQCRYRFRLLNGCNSRFLILRMSNDVPFWQIGAEQGFLAAPAKLTKLLIGPAERADVIVDFGQVPADTAITLLNLAPDEPFGGGVPCEDFDSADPQTTGQVMQFRVVKTHGPDKTTRPKLLVLTAVAPLANAPLRKLALLEEDSASVLVKEA